MRMVKFRKQIVTPLEGGRTLTRGYITVILTTSEGFIINEHEAIDYLEAAIRALPGAVCEPALAEKVLGLSQCCDGLMEGHVCPVRSYLETEVIV